MWKEIEVAVPRHDRLIGARHRQAHLRDVADRHWLQQHFAQPGFVAGGLDRADQRRAKRQHAIAVTRGAFREQYYWVAFGKPLRDLLDRLSGLLTAQPVDEHHL